MFCGYIRILKSLSVLEHLVVLLTTFAIPVSFEMVQGWRDIGLCLSCVSWGELALYFGWYQIAMLVLNRLGPQRENLSIVMDRAYEGNETRQLALALGFTPVVPPSSTRVSPWTYDMEMYKRRNEVERLFRRLKGFRRIFSRFEKLDVLFLGFILLTLIVDALR